MERPQFFTKKKDIAEGDAPSKKISLTRTLGAIFVSILVLLVLGYVAFQIFSFGSRVKAALPEIIFAYNKPAIVRPVRLKYEQKTANIDQEFLTATKSAEQKQLDELQKKLNDLEEQSATTTRSVFR